jgi:hypothetical protein
MNGSNRNVERVQVGSFMCSFVPRERRERARVGEERDQKERRKRGETQNGWFVYVQFHP